jgi:hypothetical protein
MADIVWHHRETRWKTEKTNLGLNHCATSRLYVRREKARFLQRVRIPPGNCRSSRKHSERFEEVTTWTEALQEKALVGGQRACRP